MARNAMIDWTSLKIRRGTSTAAEQADPVLKRGEPCYIIDTAKMYIGNGVDNLTHLQPIGEDNQVSVLVKTDAEWESYAEVVEAGVLCVNSTKLTMNLADGIHTYAELSILPVILDGGEEVAQNKAYTKEVI